MCLYGIAYTFHPFHVSLQFRMHGSFNHTAFFLLYAFVWCAFGIYLFSANNNFECFLIKQIKIMIISWRWQRAGLCSGGGDATQIHYYHFVLYFFMFYEHNDKIYTGYVVCGCVLCVRYLGYNS